jgi:hypothetical protein
MSGTVAVYAIQEAIEAMARIRHTPTNDYAAFDGALMALAEAEGRLRAHLWFALPQTVVVEDSAPARAA